MKLVKNPWRERTVTSGPKYSSKHGEARTTQPIVTFISSDFLTLGSHCTNWGII